ncbi:interferon-induced protein 44-like [Scomber scombrus]|uniref:interferon-induced protein 44-like n=1 Tax=Scomber scombrus TaxID=13677 RepID=UPI002DDAC022|nr:interferon-induced protein 44-like [Scomber scombrus]
MLSSLSSISAVQHTHTKAFFEALSKVFSPDNILSRGQQFSTLAKNSFPFLSRLMNCQNFLEAYSPSTWSHQTPPTPGFFAQQTPELLPSRPSAMGGKKSKQPEPPAFLDKPWREINWDEKQSDLQYVKNYKPHIKDRQLRILLHGPVGAGKSSFINSVKSVLKGRMCRVALVDNTSHDSFTKKYTTYKIEKENPSTFYPFVFNDIMGLDPSKGVLVDDIKLALKGHVKDNYVFNPEHKLSDGDQYYNPEVNPNDKVHVLACVVPADTSSQIEDEVIRKVLEIRKVARELGFPQVAIITRIDKACPEISQDLKNVYKSTYLKEKMEQFSAEVGIPMNCIFPVKNYSEEIDLNDDVDSLVLSPLRHIIDFGEDFMNHKMNQFEGYA